MIIPPYFLLPSHPEEQPRAKNRSDKVSYLMFHFSSQLGLKLVMITSAVEASRWNRSCPVACARFRVIGFMFRDTSFYSRALPTLRSGSPLGCSTLITSAPKSPR
jgi:hypothetical protein